MIDRPYINEGDPKEFLAWEVSALDLFDSVTRLARLKTEVSKLRMARDGSSERAVKRTYWPIRYVPAQRQARTWITLVDTTKIVRDTPESSMPAAISRQMTVKELRHRVGVASLVRPELVCYRYNDGDQTPWDFADREFLADLGGDVPLISRQVVYIATLQRALGALTATQPPAGRVSGS